MAASIWRGRRRTSRASRNSAGAVALVRSGESPYLSGMNGSKKDIDPTADIVEEDEESSLPEVEESSVIDLETPAGPLAARVAAHPDVHAASLSAARVCAG